VVVCCTDHSYENFSLDLSAYFSDTGENLICYLNKYFFNDLSKRISMYDQVVELSYIQVHHIIRNKGVGQQLLDKFFSINNNDIITTEAND
jgi:hypothetical protein